MLARRPTICCCSALALIVGSTLLIASAPAASLFPVRPLWTIALNNPLVAAAYRDARAFFSIGDRLASYDLSGGTLRWVVALETKLAPALSEDLLFTGEGESIAARRQSDGAVVWKLPLGDPLAVSPTWDNGWLIAGTSAGEVFAFRANDGELIWRKKQSAPLHAPAAISGERLLLPLADGHVAGLDLKTGDPAWKARRLGDQPNEILALDTLFFVGSNDKFFYCMKTSTGETVWRWATGADVIGLPVVVDRRVYFVSLDNNLRAHDAYSGAQQWSRPLPIRPTRGPLLAGDALLVSGVGPKAYAYGLLKGEPRSDVTVSGTALAAAPHVLTMPVVPFPTLILPSADIATGATIDAFSASMEPPSSANAGLADVLSKMPGATLRP